MLVYSIVNGFNFALAAPKSGPATGNLEDANVATSDAKQLWQIVASVEDLSQPAGAYILVNLATGLAAVAPTNDDTQGVAQQPVPSDPTKWTSLEWTFERAETGKNLWAIRPGRNSKQNLDAWGSKPTAGTDVGIYNWNNNNQQKWGLNPISYNP